MSHMEDSPGFCGDERQRKSITRTQDQCWKLGVSPLVHQAGGPRQKRAETGIRSEAKKDHMKQNLGLLSGSRTVLSLIATSYRWLFKLTFIKIKFKISVL